MNVSELISKIQIGLNDPAILKSDILAELNAVLLHVAAEVRLPSLIKDGTVSVATGADSGNLPADYHHDLFKAYSNTNNRRLTIRSNAKIIDRIHSETATGAIEDVAAENDKLQVGPAASSDEEIAIRYYRTPDVLANDSDIPDCIPDHLHESVLADRVITLKLPETDQDEKVVPKKMVWHNSKYEAGLAKLRQFYPNAPKAKPVLYRIVRTF